MEAFEHFFGLCPLTPRPGSDPDDVRAAFRAMRELVVDAEPANLRWSLADRRADLTHTVEVAEPR